MSLLTPTPGGALETLGDVDASERLREAKGTSLVLRYGGVLSGVERPEWGMGLLGFRQDSTKSKVAGEESSME